MLTAPFAQGSQGRAGAVAPHPMPPHMVRRGITESPTHTSPYGKGRCHGVTEGIRRSKRRGQGCGERFIKAPERGKIPH